MMLFDEVFTGFHLCWVEGVDFGNFGDKVRAKFNGVVIGMMRGELVMGFLRKDTHKVFAPFRDDWFCCLGSLCNLGGYSGLVNQFPLQPSFSFV